MYPFISLGENIQIPSFFLVISLVLSVAVLWMYQRAQAYQLPRKNILDLSLVIMAGALIGARLMHVFYENPEYYSEAPWKILYLWQGGFVYFGGVLLGLTFTFTYFHWMKISNKGDYFDAFAPVLAFTYGLGRVGCFLEGCCYGRNCNLPWAVDGRHPTQIYATLWEVGVVLLLLGIEKFPKAQRVSFLKKSGDLFLLWLLLHSLGRILMENYRDDFRGNQIFGMSVSTLICLCIITGLSGLFLKRKVAQ